MRRIKLYKKGTDAPSFIYAIVLLFAIAIVLFIFSDFFYGFYGDLQTILTTNGNDYQQANETLTQVISYEQSMWDYVYLFIVIGYVFTMGILAFQTPSNPWFFAIFIIIGMIGLFVGVALSNTWEKLAEQPTLSDTTARFPIMDTLLNNFYPLFVTFMMAMIVIMLFGKRFTGGIGVG